MAEQQISDMGIPSVRCLDLQAETNKKLVNLNSATSHTDEGKPTVSSEQHSQLSQAIEDNNNNRRKYQDYKEGKYMLPNDETEQKRLDLQHHMFLILLEGKLHLAPLKPDIKRVLDIGTGTGIWAVEFAKQYPAADVTGSDLSAIQPEVNSTPPNCHFVVADAEDDWPYAAPFDFIYMRCMLTCFARPLEIIKQVFHSLAPGGYFEILDAAFPFRSHDESMSGTALARWCAACADAGIQTGRPWTNAPRYKEWMRSVGFVDVREYVFEVPINAWPDDDTAAELGGWFRPNLDQIVAGSTKILTQGLGWDVEDVADFLCRVRGEVGDKRIHAFMSL
ncbi:methyltransferase domain-containing protein [Phlyctema vagabunda]|uniref:Methyltransferase domain-containing protein n=1 Tax=Phlyctema vagabunda TaxID=108571 RepID=A0ABR4PHD4_9HELO